MKDMIQHVSFSVSGNCDLCKERIEKAAKSVKGVKSAVWDDKTKKTHVEFDTMETSSEAIQKVIAKAGHDTEKFKADNQTYNTYCLNEITIPTLTLPVNFKLETINIVVKGICVNCI